MGEYAITVAGLCHSYGKLTAVDNINFNVREGTIFSFLGRNGAGKTTTINILITLLALQKGKVAVCGLEVAKEQAAVRKVIGVVFQDNRLDRDLTVRETLEFHGRIHALPREIRTSRIDELLALVELDDKRNQFIKNLSGGMKRRVEIARGLLTRPKVLFLDEPTVGLDTQTRRRIWSYIKRINREEGVTVFLTTHYMDEADQSSDEICIIEQGKIMVQGSPLSLKNRIAKDRFRLQTDYDARAYPLVAAFPGISRVEQTTEGLLLYPAEGGPLLSRLLETLQDRGIQVNGFNRLQPTLDDVFIQFTGRGFTEDREHWGLNDLSVEEATL